MEILFAGIQCLIFLVLIIIGEIYLETDKHKERAAVCVQRMKAHLDTWVSLTMELVEGFGRDPKAEKIRALAQNYYRCKKYRETLQKISLVNSMAELSELLADGASGAETGRILSVRADSAAELGQLWTEYNRSVKEFNSRLRKGMAAKVGKMFRQRSLEELYDLSKTVGD